MWNHYVEFPITSENAVRHDLNEVLATTLFRAAAKSTLDREGAEAFEKLDMSNYTKYTFSMFGGEVEHVTMVFQNRMMGVVIDRFGKDVVVLKENDRHFRITVAVSNQFFGWVVGLGKAVRIEAPEAVKNEFKEFLKSIQERYE